MSRRQVIVVDPAAPGEPVAGPARLCDREGSLVYSYRCPLHDEPFVVPYTSSFARRYIAARVDNACCCPGRTPWLVRLGVSGKRLLVWLLAILWAANLGDLVLTLRAVGTDRAAEANNFMGYFLHAGTFTAALVKVGLVSAAVALLWLLRRSRLVLPGAALLALLFCALIAYEAFSLAGG